MIRRLPYLDGLRALAILLVVAFHTARWNPWLNAHRYSPWGFALRQGHGVELFFVLSGFCLAYPTLARMHLFGRGEFDLARFAARRFVRIVPAYWIAIGVLLTTLIVLLRLGIAPPGSMPAHTVNPARVLAQMFMLDARPAWLNGSFWTLPIEVRWYFAFPVLLWLWTKSKPSFGAVAILCWIAHYFTRLDAPDTIALPAFMLGIAGAQVAVDRPSYARFAFPAFVLMFAFAMVQSFGVDYPQPNPFWELAMFALVVAVGENAVLERVFSLRPFAWIAAASYSIYLMHAPFVGLAEKFAPASWGAGGAALLGAAVGMASGFAFWAFVEQPLMQRAVRDRLVNVVEPSCAKLLRALRAAPCVVLVQPAFVVPATEAETGAAGMPMETSVPA